MAKSKFLQVICPKCKNKQLIFNKATLKVRCNLCNHLLVKPGGGKTKVKAAVKEVLWK